MRTLLLADDNITVQRVIALTFAQEPVRIVTASDGHQAMDRVVVDRPDIVLAGTTLPHVNGYDLSRFVKSKPESKDVPVLLLSGAFEPVDKAQLLASGANGVIEKPVEPTAMIRRVKELLGLKTEDAAPAAGRLVTPATVAAGQRSAPTLPRAVTTSRPMPTGWEGLRGQTLDKDARPVEDTTGRDEYLESLGDAFDTLDEQLAGREPTTAPCNPSPPLGQLNQSGDPRSPGRMPAAPPAAPPGNPVYEVDEDWFGDKEAKDDTRAGRREMTDEVRGAGQQPDAPRPAQPVYEVDDEWFAEDQKAREARQMEQRELAREMGIHEVEVSVFAPSDAEEPRREPADEEPEPAPALPAASDDDVELGEADLIAVVATWSVEPSTPTAAPKAVDPPKSVEPPKVAPAPKVVESPTVVEAPTVVEPPKPAQVRLVPDLVIPVVEVALASAGYPGDPEHRKKPEPAPVIELTLSDHRDEEALAITPMAGTLPIDFLEAISMKQREPAPPAAQGTRVAPDVPRPTDAFLTSTTAPRRDSRNVADDFDALLAFEQGKKSAPPMIEPIIHAVTPEITGEMITEIATTVADRLGQHIPAPEITGEIIKTIAFLVSGSLKDQIRVQPVAPQITGEMLDRISATVSDRLRHTITIEAVAPELTPPMLEQVAATVAGHLKDSIRVEPVEPQITQPMLDHIAAVVANRLANTIRVEPAAPKISEQMLDYIAAVVSERLKNHIHIEPVPPPQITDEMLERVAGRVAERVPGSFSIDQLRDSIAGAIRDTVRVVISETSERLVREEIERIRSQTP